MTARAAGQEVMVTYAGSQGGLPGVDQVNLRRSRSLAGAGRVSVGLSVDGRDANQVFINVR